jgi:hypothetical protein
MIVLLSRLGLRSWCLRLRGLLAGLEEKEEAKDAMGWEWGREGMYLEILFCSGGWGWGMGMHGCFRSECLTGFGGLTFWNGGLGRTLVFSESVSQHSTTACIVERTLSDVNPQR